MILLSKIIKASFLSDKVSDRKIIEIKNFYPNQTEQQESKGDLELQKKQVELILQTAKKEAEAIKQEAKIYYESVQQQILQEKEEWHSEREHLKELARKEGYEIGLQQGKEEGLKQFSQTINHAHEIVETANRDFYKLIEEADETILLIGIKVAERILSERLNENREQFVPLVKQAIREVREHSEVKICVHPRYYETVVEKRDELRLVFNREIDIFIYPDDQLPENGCVIESSYGRIDAGIDTQLQQLKEKLLERFGHKEE